MTRRTRGVLAIAAVALAVGGCSSSESSGTGQLAVRLTDAPGDFVQSATVWVSSLYLIGGTDTTSSRIVISSTPARYDLLALQGGVTAALGTATIPVGDYSQMRLVVDSARVTLKSPLTFVGGLSSAALQTPSGQQTGIKVNFSAPVHVAPGQTVLVVDFDVSRSFVFTGQASNPTGVIFKPVLHATVQDIAASVAGTVSPASAKAKLFAIVGTDTVATAFADTTTGAYVLRYLDPRVSPFTVAATAAGYMTQTKTVPLRTAQDTTGVNFTLTP